MDKSSDFDVFCIEFEEQHPEEMAKAKIWAKEYLDKIRSGEERFNIQPVVFVDSENPQKS